MQSALPTRRSLNGNFPEYDEQRGRIGARSLLSGISDRPRSIDPLHRSLPAESNEKILKSQASKCLSWLSLFDRATSGY